MTVRLMQLAKHGIDVGLSTNNLEPMLRFWQQDVGLRFDYVLPVRRGQNQYRHEAQGSVIKLNHHAEPLPTAAPSGYRELTQLPALAATGYGDRPLSCLLFWRGIAVGLLSLSQFR